MTDAAATPHPSIWPERSWILGAVGALICAIFAQIAQNFTSSGEAAFAFGLIAAGVVLAFVLDRRHLIASAFFPLIAGAIVALAIYWNVDVSHDDPSEVMRVVCAAAAIGIAGPLFQAWLSAGRPRNGGLATIFPVQRVHEAAWSDAVIWITSWAFAGLCILMTVLIGSLFKLIGISAIMDLLNNSWFIGALAGGAFGVAAGVLRDREKIVITLQNLLRTILAVLAPIVGVALAIFLVASIFTGMSSLWEETKATTPILLATFIAAIVLANAVIGDGPEDESRVGAVRLGGRLLGATLLPIGLLTTYSTGIRIGQYGFTPDRIWAMIFTVIAAAIGVGYIVALFRNRAEWPAALRNANIRLGLGICGVLLFLALPILNFQQISVNDQVARLESGQTKFSEFSWEDMRFSYGQPGIDALTALARDGKTPEIRKSASEHLAMKQDERFGRHSEVASRTQAETDVAQKLIVKPGGGIVPETLRNILIERRACSQDFDCMLYHVPGSTTATLISRSCKTCQPVIDHYLATKTGWDSADYEAAWNGKESGTPDPFSGAKVEMRDVTMQQLYIGEQPVGEPLAK